MYIYLYLYLYLYICLFIITKPIIISPMPFVYTKTRNGKTLLIKITSRSCKVSLFPRSRKNEVIFCICLYI